MATSRTRNLLGNLTLLAVSTVVSLLLLEQGYRFFLFGWSSLSVTKMNSLHGIGVSGVLQPSAHKDIIYEHKPNLRTHFKLTPFDTNSHGLRDRESTGTRYEVLNFAVSGLQPAPVCRGRYAFFNSFALQGLRSNRAFGVERRIRDKAIVPKLKKKHQRYLSEYLERLWVFSQARAVPVVVVQLDIRWYEVPFLDQKLRELGFPSLNASLSFRDREFGDYILHPLDLHPNSEAHEVFADKIHDFLKPIIDRPRSPA